MQPYLAEHELLRQGIAASRTVVGEYLGFVSAELYQKRRAMWISIENLNCFPRRVVHRYYFEEKLKLTNQSVRRELPMVISG